MKALFKHKGTVSFICSAMFITAGTLGAWYVPKFAFVFATLFFLAVGGLAWYLITGIDAPEFDD